MLLGFSSSFLLSSLVYSALVYSFQIFAMDKWNCCIFPSSYCSKGIIWGFDADSPSCSSLYHRSFTSLGAAGFIALLVCIIEHLHPPGLLDYLISFYNIFRSFLEIIWCIFWRKLICYHSPSWVKSSSKLLSDLTCYSLEFISLKIHYLCII